MVHDPAKVADRFYELADNSQVVRDELAGGWTSAQFIQKHFRNEWMFLTHNHPNLRLAAYLASGIYKRLGVSEADISRVIGSWGKQTPFARVQAPIHPGIARHFKLTFIAEGQTFESFVGELETFEAYCRRYLAYDWNRDLASGIELAKRPDSPGHDIDHSIGLLQSGLGQSSGSAIGELALAHLLLRVGRIDEATSASERACALDKDNYRNFAFYGQMLLRGRRFAEAFDLLDRATRDFPGIAQMWDSYSVALTNIGKIEGAAAALKRAMEIEPFNTRFVERLRGLEERFQLVPSS
jgi:tetratricopeptide (TPR) repeat protein